MTTFRLHKYGRIFTVHTSPHGSRHLVNDIYYGGLCLATTNSNGPNGESTMTIKQALEAANIRANQLSIDIDQ